MTCKEITELVTDYLERRLSLRDRLRFRWHLGFCTFCRAYLRQMRATIRIAGRLPDEPLPHAVEAELRRGSRDFGRGRAGARSGAGPRRGPRRSAVRRFPRENEG